MTQKFYFRDAATTVTGTLPATGTSQSATTPTVTATGAGTNRSMNGTKGTLQVASTLATLANVTTQNNWFRRFVSPPLAAQTATVFSMTLAIGWITSSASNSQWQIAAEVYAWRPSTGAKIATLYPEASGLGGGLAIASETTNISSVTNSSSVSWLDGDILIVEIWSFIAAQGMATSVTWTFDYDGTTDIAAAGASGTAIASAGSFIDMGVDLPLFVASSFMPKSNKPILQAVNRAATF